MHPSAARQILPDVQGVNPSAGPNGRVRSRNGNWVLLEGTFQNSKLSSSSFAFFSTVVASNFFRIASLAFRSSDTYLTFPPFRYPRCISNIWNGRDP